MSIPFLIEWDWTGVTSPNCSLFSSAAALEGRTTRPFQDRSPSERHEPDSDRPEVALLRRRSRRNGCRFIPAVGQLVDNTHDSIELPGQAGQYLDVALPVDLAREGGNVPANF